MTEFCKTVYHKIIHSQKKKKSQNKDRKTSMLSFLAQNTGKAIHNPETQNIREKRQKS